MVRPLPLWEIMDPPPVSHSFSRNVSGPLRFINIRAKAILLKMDA